MYINETEKPHEESLRPSIFKKSGPSSSSFSNSNSNNKMLKHLRKLINQQIKIHKKASSIIDGIPPDSFISSLKIPIKTSRLYPYTLNTIKLNPLISQTPEPRREKKIRTVQKQAIEKNPITVLQVYKKKLISRKEKIVMSNRVEVAIDTREITYIPDNMSEDNIEADIKDYLKQEN